MQIKQGGVYLAYLDLAKGGEQKGNRPVVVISPDEIQGNLSRAIVAPCTTIFRDYPTYTPLNINGKQSYAMLDQMRTIDSSRMKSKMT